MNNNVKNKKKVSSKNAQYWSENKQLPGPCFYCNRYIFNEINGPINIMLSKFYHLKKKKSICIPQPSKFNSIWIDK